MSKYSLEDIKENIVTALCEIEFDIGSIHFESDDEDNLKSKEELALRIANKYDSKIDEIVDFIYDEVVVFWNITDKQEIKDKLGNPTINLDSPIISYANNKFDDIHIVQVEFKGDLDRFTFCGVEG